MKLKKLQSDLESGNQYKIDHVHFLMMPLMIPVESRLNKSPDDDSMDELFQKLMNDNFEQILECIDGFTYKAILSKVETFYHSGVYMNPKLFPYKTSYSNMA